MHVATASHLFWGEREGRGQGGNFLVGAKTIFSVGAAVSYVIMHIANDAITVKNDVC